MGGLFLFGYGVLTLGLVALTGLTVGFVSKIGYGVALNFLEIMARARQLEIDHRQAVMRLEWEDYSIERLIEQRLALRGGINDSPQPD